MSRRPDHVEDDAGVQYILDPDAVAYARLVPSTKTRIAVTGTEGCYHTFPQRLYLYLRGGQCEQLEGDSAVRVWAMLQAWRGKTRSEQEDQSP